MPQSTESRVYVDKTKNEFAVYTVAPGKQGLDTYSTWSAQIVRCAQFHHVPFYQLTGGGYFCQWLNGKGRVVRIWLVAKRDDLKWIVADAIVSPSDWQTDELFFRFIGERMPAFRDPAMPNLAGSWELSLEHGETLQIPEGWFDSSAQLGGPRTIGILVRPGEKGAADVWVIRGKGVKVEVQAWSSPQFKYEAAKLREQLIANSKS